MGGGGAAEDVEDDEGQDDGGGSVHGAGEGLADALPHDLEERLLAGGGPKVLADAVEDDDGVVDGEAEDDEDGRDEEGVDFIAEEVPQDGEGAHGDDDIVDERDDGHQAVLPGRDRLGDLAEGPGDVDDDAEDDEEDRDYGALDGFEAKDRTDGIERGDGRGGGAVQGQGAHHGGFLILVDGLHAHDESAGAGRADGNGRVDGRECLGYGRLVGIAARI